MNRENMQRLLAFYEAGAPEFKFNMHLPFQTFQGRHIPQLCGSAGCIAGSAFAMAFETIPAADRKAAMLQIGFTSEGTGKEMVTDFYWTDVQSRAMVFLGLEETECSGNIRHPLFDPNKAPETCTAAHAAQAIRNMLDGKEPWEGM